MESYLRAARLNVERQVMLEAKIIDVQLPPVPEADTNEAETPPDPDPALEEDDE